MSILYVIIRNGLAFPITKLFAQGENSTHMGS